MAEVRVVSPAASRTVLVPSAQRRVVVNSRGQPGYPTALPLAFHVAGPLTDGSASAFFFAPTGGFLATLYGVTSGGTVDVDVTIDGAAVSAPLTCSSVAGSRSLNSEPVALGQRVGLVLSNTTGGADLSVTVSLTRE